MDRDFESLFAKSTTNRQRSPRRQDNKHTNGTNKHTNGTNKQTNHTNKQTNHTNKQTNHTNKPTKSIEKKENQARERENRARIVLGLGQDCVISPAQTVKPGGFPYGASRK
eukprot:UN11807